jgi:2',3'-cyclic-nucleotide 2'-phosphodiesterase (5'-nucleotidase family)
MRPRVLTAFLTLILALSACHPNRTVIKQESTAYVLSDSTNTDTDEKVNLLIRPYRDSMKTEMSERLAESEFAMERGIPESRLGNFVSDACLYILHKNFYSPEGNAVDFIFLNNGGLRKALPAGVITRGDVFELMPFENELVVLTVNGKDVKKIFNFIASKGGAPVAGVRFTIQQETAENIFINGQPLDSLSTYYAATSDYLANGGDSYSFLSALKKETTGIKVRDAIITFLQLAGKENRKITVNTDGRISNDK